MNDNTPPATAHADPTGTPRFISHAQMREHQDNQLVTVLSSHDRHRMFIRYDNTWWIGDQDGFTEITNPAHNTRLDLWHQRLTNGALWA